MLIVGHQVVVLCLRYLVEKMTEEQILAVDAEGDVVNCGVTEYRFDPAAGWAAGFRCARYNFAAPLERGGRARHGGAGRFGGRAVSGDGPAPVTPELLRTCPCRGTRKG